MSAKRSGSFHIVSTTAAPIICPLCNVAHTTVDQTLFNTYQYLYFTAGVYTPAAKYYTIAGNYIIGDGISRTVLNCAFQKIGSNTHIGGQSRYGLTLGRGYNTAGATGSAFTFADGASVVRFGSVRFRRYHTSVDSPLWDLRDYCQWPATEHPSTAEIVYPNRKCNVKNVEFSDCEFEWTHHAGTQFNAWWDVRANGGNIDDFTWQRCVFHCRDASGLYPGYGGASPIACGILLQPAPSEHSPNGPRPDGAPVNYGFDWRSCTHGAGKSSEYASPQGFLIKDSYFLGDDTTGQIDVCCNTRSYWFSTKQVEGQYFYTTEMIDDYENCTDEDRQVTPSLYNDDGWDIGTNTGWRLENVWFGGGARLEIGPFENPEWDENGLRRESASTNSIPELVYARWRDSETGNATNRYEWIYLDHRGDANNTYYSINGANYSQTEMIYNVPPKTVANEQALYGLQPLGTTVQGPVGQIPTP